MYNVKTCIKETIESIKKQKYCGNIYTILIDDGSTDGSLEFVKSLDLGSKTTLLELEHEGKAFALNEALKHVKTDYTITVDADTVLHPLAVRNIMHQLVNSDKKTAATAGCLFVKNTKRNFITKLQEWDYSLGIFGVKLYQGNYQSTLVAQWAFSAGMIEAFKRVKIVTSKKLKFKSRFLMCLNIFFPFIDLALLIFIPLGLILLLLGNPLLIGWLSLLVILLGMLLCFVIEIRRKSMLREINMKPERRSVLAFIFYILFYAFMLTPFCIIGYIAELINAKKEW